MKDEYFPTCFGTKQYNKGNGICRRCHKVRDCEINILLKSGACYIPPKSKSIKGGKNGNNNRKKRRKKKARILVLY